MSAWLVHFALHQGVMDMILHRQHHDMKFSSTWVGTRMREDQSLVKLQSKVKSNKMSMRFGSCFLPQKGRKRAFPQGMHTLHAGLYQPVPPNSPHISFPFGPDWCFSMFFILHKPFCLESEVETLYPLDLFPFLCMLLRSRSSKRCKTLKLLLQFVLLISWKPLHSCWFVVKVHTVTGWEY